MYVNDSGCEFPIKQFRNGNSKCFDQLLERYKQRVFSYIFQMVKTMIMPMIFFKKYLLK